MLEFRQVSRRYKSLVALEGLSFRVAPGEIYGLLGPNGAGKSTAIRIATGLVRADAGDVLVGGRSVAANPIRALVRTGALIDTPAFHGHLSARHALAALAALAGRGAPDAGAREAMLTRVGLASRGDDPVRTYSSGMKQRLALAAAFMGAPELVILDEPTNGLDPEGRDDMIALARDIAARGGPAILVTSHIFDEAARLCDRVGILSAGRLVHEGAAGDAARLRDVFLAQTREVPA